jgi:hypothetical protein
VDRHVNLGVIAETIFFYRSTHLLLDHGSLIALAKNLSPDDLIEMFDRTKTKLTYIQPTFAVVKTGMPPTNQFVAFQFGGNQERKVSHYKEEISMMLECALGQSTDTRKLVKSINDRVALHRFSKPEKENIITRLAQEDATDKSFVRNSVVVMLDYLVPGFRIPKDFRFELIDTGQGYAIDTNLNFAEINRLYHILVSSEHSTITSEYLLAHLITARADSFFAANYMSEIVTAPIYSDLIRLKHFEFLLRRDSNAQAAKLFHDTVLPDFPTISEAIDSGQRTIPEFLNLLDQAEKFKGWLTEANPDSGLIRNYFRAATEKTWADKLPTKSIRFSIATGLGMLADAILPTGLGTAVGLSIGAGDSMYLDKLIKGWRPNQFIDGPYRKFVERKVDAAA